MLGLGLEGFKLGIALFLAEKKEIYKMEYILLTHEQKELIKDEVERRYKEKKGYTGNWNWSYSQDDRNIMRSTWDLEILKEQAKISFKAGIKNVVDWIISNASRSQPHSFEITLSHKEWEKKLIEWGL